MAESACRGYAMGGRASLPLRQGAHIIWLQMSLRLGAVAVSLLLLAISCRGGGDELILATTTSVQDTGLLDELREAYEDGTGYDMKPLAVGSGQALALGRRGEVDAVFTHSPADEAAFVAEGDGVGRREVMRNRFVVVGPEEDRAGVRGLSSAVEAFRRIAATRSRFISRGDRSGTHQRELSLWRAAGVVPGGSWYQESGAGQGTNLFIASDKDAYALSDDSTFAVLRKRLDLEILVSDPELVNVYSVIVVNAARHRQVNEEPARAFLAFMTSSRAQEIVRRFGLEEFGRPLFEPVPAVPLGGY
ncbi:MAG: substrate-binding domain-containing protein [Dehalococcoidia bacterium]